MSDPTGQNPFLDPISEREPARRMRGRLTAPVTVWTSGAGDQRTGLTVSSMLVADGKPPLILGLLKETTDLCEQILFTGVFVVHVLAADQRDLADVFAGLRPSPGGLFAAIPFTDGEWGPQLSQVPNRIYCRLQDSRPAGYHLLVEAAAEAFEVAEMDKPLAYFRGSYRHLEDRN